MEATPGPSLAGAHCAAHEGAQATGTCERCGNFVCPLCIDPSADRDVWCEACREREGGDRVPWERDEGSVLARWWRTVRSVMFSPSQTFERVRPGSLSKAALFNGLTGVLLGVVVLAFGICGLGLLFSVGPAGGLDRLTRLEGGGEIALALVGATLLISPLATALYTLAMVGVRGSVFFVALQLAGAGGEAKTPFWVVSYLGAMQLSWIPIVIVQQIPFIGPFVAIFGHLAVEVWYALQLTQAAERFYGLSAGRAAFAGWAFFVLLSVLLGSCCLGGMVLGASRF